MALVDLSRRASFGSLRVVGSEDITVDATAGGVALTATKYSPQLGPDASFKSPPGIAVITVEAQPLRWKVDPAVTLDATTNGHVAVATDIIVIEGQALVNFRAIRTTGSSATIHVTYFA